MKTMIEFADEVFFRMKARAALEGRSWQAFLHAAIEEKLGQRRPTDRRRAGWRSVFGKGPRRSLMEVQARIDREFSKLCMEKPDLPSHRT